MRSLAHWRLRTRTLELGTRTLLMGVVNITPDSFSDGGLFLSPQAAVAHGLKLIEEGADILDLGAESTRPGSRAGGANAAVSVDEEQARLLPVVEGILKRLPRAVVSVDTYKAATARAALATGAEIVNDVSGFTWDPAITEVCAEFHAGVVLSHTRGRPEEWRAQPQLEPDALLATVREGLAASLACRATRRNSVRCHSCSTRATDSANASARTTHFSRVSQNCSNSAGRCLPGSAANRSSATCCRRSSVVGPRR